MHELWEKINLKRNSLQSTGEWETDPFICLSRGIGGGDKGCQNSDLQPRVHDKFKQALRDFFKNKQYLFVFVKLQNFPLTNKPPSLNWTVPVKFYTSLGWKTHSLRHFQSANTGSSPQVLSFNFSLTEFHYKRGEFKKWVRVTTCLEIWGIYWQPSGWHKVLLWINK